MVLAQNLIISILCDIKRQALRPDCSMKNKNRVIVLAVAIVVGFASPLAAAADELKIERHRPSDIVDVGRAIPQMQFDMRYFSSHNFVGRRIHGYEQDVCLLTAPAAAALKKVEDKLLPMGLTLKAYDCYRPQRAVDDFVRWAADTQDAKMKAEFYASVPKDRLFDEGYIAAHSGHSRGSTIDLTIVPVGSVIPRAAENTALADCAGPAAARVPDNSLDFGTGYDCFSEASHPSFQNIPAQAKANRLLLQSLMADAGFAPLDTEWWHFTLKNEPYPQTYFDFPVSRLP
jgi:D-alanyl-D-alanine dipeptidase